MRSTEPLGGEYSQTLLSGIEDEQRVIRAGLNARDPSELTWAFAVSSDGRQELTVGSQEA